MRGHRTNRMDLSPSERGGSPELQGNRVAGKQAMEEGLAPFLFWLIQLLNRFGESVQELFTSLLVRIPCGELAHVLADRVRIRDIVLMTMRIHHALLLSAAL